MPIDDLGKYFREEREKADLTQQELADKAHISRTSIILIEQGKRGKNITANTLIKLSNALKLNPQPVLEAMGLKYTIHDLPESSRLPSPDRIPIYKDFPFHAGSPARPTDYFYRTWPGKAPKNIEGYPVRGTCLEPDIKEGDVIIVDREGSIDNGDIVACLINDELHIGRLRKIADELWLENNQGRFKFQECTVAAPVIEINRRIK